MRVILVGTASLVLLLATGCTNAGGCKLNNVAINSVAADRLDVFAGKSDRIEVQFLNERTKGEVTVFPEPPLSVINIASKARCAINGGVWVRKAVYLSSDDKVLVTQEFSGSNDSLNFYDTATCRKLRSIDVSNATWNVSGSEIQVSGPAGAGRNAPQATTYQLGTDCLPTKKARG